MSYKQEEIKPYSSKGDKEPQVERMFDNIAHSYDRLNHIMSLGVDKKWRRAAIEQLKPYEPEYILDVATGTGDFAILAAKMLRPKMLIGIDISEKMLQIGHMKAAKAGLGKVITFSKDDCLRLSFESSSFDAVTVAYGVRNFSDLERGLSEMLRVLRPGGHIVIAELTAPRQFPMRQLFWLYSHCAMPLAGRLLARDGSAYRYLPATMEAFPQGEEMASILRRAGFADVRFRRFTFGLNTLYTAIRPPKSRQE